MRKKTMYKYKVYLPEIREHKIVDLNDIGPLALGHPGLIIQEKVWVEEASFMDTPFVAPRGALQDGVVIDVDCADEELDGFLEGGCASG